ncbi:hypothetical protein Tco_0707696 [Tanacetum coccineum]|uniref:Uncharacterized protein n=1 Tax=Tanacetum coccineum TaxID=301880 RepID=A0ABQ4YBS3_9ASTR
MGLRHHSPTPQGAAVVAVPSSDRHHDGSGGDEVVLVVADLVAAVVMRSDGDGVAVVMMVRVWWLWWCRGDVDSDEGGVACHRCWWCDGVDRDDEDGVVAATSSPEKVGVRRKNPPEKFSGGLGRTGLRGGVVPEKLERREEKRENLGCDVCRV